MSIFSLVYVSFATEKMTEDELRQILSEARDNNKKLNITGMLLYREGFFIQALEGEQEVVESLYKKIAKDRRHKNVTLVYTHEIDKRGFGDWSMGFNILSDDHVAQIPGFTDFLEDPDDASFILEHPGKATDLLESFKHHNYI